MKIQQIRNATIIIEYAGKIFLVDPMLGEKGSFAPFPFSHHQELRRIMALPTWKSLAKTHVSATSVCQRQKAITATGGCSPQQVTPAAMCYVIRQNQSAIWQVTQSGTAAYAEI